MASAVSETQRLRRTMRDLVSITALSAGWVEQGQERIAQDLAEVLLRVLHLDFALVRLRGQDGEDVRDVVRTAQPDGLSNASQAIVQALAPWLDTGAELPSSILDPVGSGWVRLHAVAIGDLGECGVFFAGSAEADFPSDDDRTLMSVAVNQAAVMLLRGRATVALNKYEQTRHRLAAIVESCDDAVIAKTLDGVIESWNPGAERLYGYAAEEAVGKPISILIPLDHPDELPGIMEKLKRGERIEHYETVRVRKDGVRLDVSVSISPVRDADGAIVGASIIARDISERKRTEEALKDADRRKNEFLAMLGHELRNPLAAIASANQGLDVLGSQDQKAERLRSVIRRQVGHLTHMVDDLLDVSRISRGKLRLDRVPVDVETIIERAIEMAQPLIDARKHVLSVSLPPKHVMLNADLVRMTQIVVNLLSNAAKYTEDGGRVELVVRSDAAEVAITVRDTGIGIPQEMLRQIFEPFSQVDPSLHRAQGGLGIGLALVKSLVELHGGTVHVVSAGVGQGAAFTVRMPILAEPLPAASAIGQRRSPTRAETARRILIVDDSPDVADCLAMMLHFCGHDVRTEYSGPTGIEVATEFRPEMILMDIGLPGMNGYEVARRMRADPDLSGVFLVALTGYAQEDDRVRARQAGFDCYVVKPVGLEILESLISQIDARVDGTREKDARRSMTES